jgi:hypothetical protein
MPYPHQFIKLTDRERLIVSAELKRLAIEGKHKKRLPLNILYWSDRGKTFKVITQLTLASYSTVRRYIYLYRKQRLKPFIGR